MVATGARAPARAGERGDLGGGGQLPLRQAARRERAGAAARRVPGARHARGELAGRRVRRRGARVRSPTRGSSGRRRAPRPPGRFRDPRARASSCSIEVGLTAATGRRAGASRALGRG